MLGAAQPPLVTCLPWSLKTMKPFPPGNFPTVLLGTVLWPKYICLFYPRVMKPDFRDERKTLFLLHAGLCALYFLCADIRTGSGRGSAWPKATEGAIPGQEACAAFHALVRCGAVAQPPSALPWAGRQAWVLCWGQGCVQMEMDAGRTAAALAHSQGPPPPARLWGGSVWCSRSLSCSPRAPSPPWAPALGERPWLPLRVS